jgi:hypothetical protein
VILRAFGWMWEFQLGRSANAPEGGCSVGGLSLQAH